MPRSSQLIRHQAIALRANTTPAEAKLWRHLRARQLDGYKFRRQHPIDQFIVDFICIERQLIIEVDGRVHDTQTERDEERTQLLRFQGYTVARWTNEQVLNDTAAVIDEIRELLQADAARL